MKFDDILGQGQKFLRTPQGQAASRKAASAAGDALKRGQQFLGTEKGRSTGHKVTDAALGAARRVSPKHARMIDGVGRAAHGYIDRQAGRGGQGPTVPGDAR